MTPPQPRSEPLPSETSDNATLPPGPTGTDLGATQSHSPVARFDTILAPPQQEDEIGRLGGCRVLRLIGEGGMGFVFEAEQLLPKRRVAIKVMRPEVAAFPEAKGRFLREANTAAALTSDHVVTIFHVAEERGVPFLSMPLMKGETLYDRLKREGKLPTAETLRIGRETAKGLAAAHAAGLIHRDIKPANLWLEEGSGRVKILDFGLARPGQGGEQYTRTGQMLGTPAYMAPEQANGRALDGRADLFSLGCVLYELTTGRRAFQGTDILPLLCSLAMDHPPPPQMLDPLVPAQLSELVMRLLAKDAAGRPDSASAVVAELRAIRAESTGRRPAPITSRQTDRPEAKSAAPRPRPREDGAVQVPAPTRRGLRSVVVGLLALVGVGLIAWALRSQFGNTGAGSDKTAYPKPVVVVRPSGTLALDLGDGILLECVRIPEGTFTMGSSDGEIADQTPPHRVTISKAFYLGKFEVSVGQFRRFAEANNGFRTEAETDGQGGGGLTADGNLVAKPEYSWKNVGWPQSDRHPVVNVSWNDVQKFCAWLSGRTGEQVTLPTEAEWEYACRAGTTTKFAFGDHPEAFPRFANMRDAAMERSLHRQLGIHGDDGHAWTAPVGTFLPNAFGLYDMHGNVCEWCRDGPRTYQDRDETDPVGPMVGGYQSVYRGGSFNDYPLNCRAACRAPCGPSLRFPILGFRVAVIR